MGVLRGSGLKAAEDAMREQIKAQAVQTALALLGALTGDTQSARATLEFVAPPSPHENAAPIVAISAEILKAQELATRSTVAEAPRRSIQAVNGTLTLADQLAITNRVVTGITNLLQV